MKWNRPKPLSLSFFSISVLLLPFSIVPALADDDQPAIIGLWQAIDSFDGSTQLLSITCSDQKDCDVRLNDTAFTLSCQNQIGFAQGVGSIDHNVLTVELTLHCSNLDGTSILAGTQVNKFVLDRSNDTLTNFNDDPTPVPNVFHRISK